MTAVLDIGVYGARGIPSTYSGYETFLTVLLPELVRRGHYVTMYCRRGQFSDGQPYQGVRRVMLPALASYQLETLSHGVPAAVAARLRRHQVVFVVNIANAPYCFMAKATRQRTVLNTDGQEWIRGKWGTWARRYWRLCARLAGPSASALVADSKAMGDVYREGFNAESTVIPYCWTELTPAEDPSYVLDPLELEAYRYFLVAARLNPENGVGEMARAYARSSSGYPLVVLGAANYATPVQAELERLAQGCPLVRLEGHVSDRSRFATLLSYSAAHLHGHRVGGVNPSLIEAMGCGANVIALATPFNQEALGPAGTYFSDFDEELPAVLAATEAEPAPAGSARRQRARLRARQVFGVEAIVDAYEELFGVVARRSPWQTTVRRTPWLGP
ncbi:MAG: DUF1972 domain-containing protein [Actinomycetota bacterium]|nr:DUF1972 domain-containing protein [Actinomycetota bacterium]